MKKLIKLSTLLALCVGILSGCQNATLTPSAEQKRLISAVQNTGAGFYEDHGNVTITIPVNRVFPNKSSAIYISSLNLLNYTIQLLNTYHKEEIAILGFNSKNQSLALAQAQAIQAYFWKHHLDTRILYSKGFLIDSRSNEIPRIEIRAE
jgi:hypothetical protein